MNKPSSRGGEGDGYGASPAGWLVSLTGEADGGSTGDSRRLECHLTAAEIAAGPTVRLVDLLD